MPALLIEAKLLVESRTYFMKPPTNFPKVSFDLFRVPLEMVFDEFGSFLKLIIFKPSVQKDIVDSKTNIILRTSDALLDLSCHVFE